MALEELKLDPAGAPLPEDVSSLIEEAERRIDHFFETERNRRFPKFIPFDPVLFHGALADITNRDLPLGRVFCEWGSGFGVASCIASLLGYEATGIDIELELVENARKLAGDLRIPADFLCTTYIPEGLESYEGVGGEELVHQGDSFSVPGEAGERPFYEDMKHDTEEIDVFYVYPWPGQQEFMLELFDAVAAEGAILLAYYGDGEFCAYRRTFEE